MFNKTKSATIFAMITLIVVIVGFVLVFTRKQTVTDGVVKSYWRKPKEDEKPA